MGGFENFQFMTSNVFVALGRGDGRFRPAYLTSTGDSNTRALSVAVGDVTGDGKPDIVSNSAGQLSVLPGKGDGTFKQPILSGSSGGVQNQILLGDVTGDGVTDAVAVIETGGRDFSAGDVIIEQGDGTGHFVEVRRIVTDTNLRGGALADLTGDGRLDLAVNGRGGSNGGRSGMYVVLNSASGLGAATYYASGSGYLVAGDFNRDRRIDLAVDGPHSTTDVDLNQGKGRFQTGTRIVSSAAPAAAGDVTGNPAPEIFSLPSAFSASFGYVIDTTRR